MSVCLDRFAYGPADPQETATVAVCEVCRGEIYPGEDVLVLDGHILHDDDECLREYVQPERMSIEEAARAVLGV